MSFFTSSPRPPKGSGRWILLSLAVITLGSMVVLPTGYVIERPGQVFNVMGEISGQKVISSSDLEVYESESRFDVTTVSLLGNRESTPSWVQVLWAWADPEQIVLPLDEVYPPNLTTAEIRAESTAQMEVSQQDAIAAALSEMGYEIPRTLYVASVIADAPSSGILVAGDFVVSASGVDVSTFDELKSQIQLSEGLPIVIEVVRDGQPRALEITPEKRETDWVIGAMVGYTYDFPVDIQLQLGDVGGPSGGLMFSLGILDALSEGSMAGGLHVSGTGT
ncbi:MAG: ATP-dependent serine peptidase containing a PDZ domain protein, partial [Aquiluna sp.]